MQDCCLDTIFSALHTRTTLSLITDVALPRILKRRRDCSFPAKSHLMPVAKCKEGSTRLRCLHPLITPPPTPPSSVGRPGHEPHAHQQLGPLKPCRRRAEPNDGWGGRGRERERSEEKGEDCVTNYSSNITTTSNYNSNILEISNTNELKTNVLHRKELPAVRCFAHVG